MSDERKKYDKAEREWLDDCAKLALQGVFSNPKADWGFDDLFADAETMLAKSIERYGPLGLESAQPSASQWLPVSKLMEAKDGPMWISLTDECASHYRVFDEQRIGLAIWSASAATLYADGLQFAPKAITHFMPITKPELPK
jgi:hypothetical protein